MVFQVENEEEEECKDQQAQAREGCEVKNKLLKQTKVLVQEDKHWHCIECSCGPQANEELRNFEEEEEEDKDGVDMEVTAGSVAALSETQVGDKRKKQKQERSPRQLGEDEDLVGWLQSGNVPTEALNLITVFVEWQMEHN